MNPAVFLVAGSLLLAMLRFRQPWAARPTGALLRTSPVPLRAKVRLQRANVYAIGALMLLGGLGGWIPSVVQLGMAIVVIGVLLLPLNYTLTSDGIALGRTPMRPWSAFSEVEVAAGRATLIGEEGDELDVWLPVPDAAAVVADLRRLVRGAVMVGNGDVRRGGPAAKAGRSATRRAVS